MSPESPVHPSNLPKTMGDQKIQAIIDAEAAHAAGEFAQAAEHYSRALEALDAQDFAGTYELYLKRLECYERLGDMVAQEAELGAMLALGEQ